MPIGRFEGVEQVLARMAARTYIMDAARPVTAGAIDGGEKPSVPSAMLKYHATEFGRMIANDAMDVHGGKGICLGPKNYLGRGYQIVPVAITVEGANILTRSLIIFGQGAVRCHPFVLREMNAARNPDREAGIAEFDRALMGHIGFAICNAARSLVLGLTLARFTQLLQSRRTSARCTPHSRVPGALAHKQHKSQRREHRLRRPAKGLASAPRRGASQKRHRLRRRKSRPGEGALSSTGTKHSPSPSSR